MKSTLEYFRFIGYLHNAACVTHHPNPNWTLTTLCLMEVSNGKIIFCSYLTVTSTAVLIVNVTQDDLDNKGNEIPGELDVFPWYLQKALLRGLGVHNVVIGVNSHHRGRVL